MNKVIYYRFDKELHMEQVSVIIPVYNGQKFIKRAILSAVSQEVEVKIIVIDDNSIDDTAIIVQELAKEYRQIYYLKNNMRSGVAYSRNVGVLNSSTKYIAYLDADDWWEPNKLKKQLLFMKENKECHFCYTGRTIWDDNGIKKGQIIDCPFKVQFQDLVKHNCITCSSVLMERDLALKYPMECDEIHEDYFTWLRILGDGEAAYGLQEGLVNYTLTPLGKSRNKIISAKMTYKTYRHFGIGRNKSFYFLLSHLLHGIKKYRNVKR